MYWHRRYCISHQQEQLCTGTEDISNQQEQVSTNKEDISHQQEQLCTDTEDISNQQEQVSTGTEDISHQQEQLCTDTEDIRYMQKVLQSLGIITSNTSKNYVRPRPSKNSMLKLKIPLKTGPWLYNIFTGN